MRPLAEKRVIDLSRYAPGPYASLVCAALGAGVVKVEAPPDGDPMRVVDPDGFRRLNRGKKSVVIDLKSERGLADARRLVAGADVVIESFRPGVVTRLGLDYETVRVDSPELVYVSISGYGQSGPWADRAGHDVNYVAAAGALGDASSPLPLQVADFAAGGLYAVVAILAALMEGTGTFIDLSMHEGMLSLAPVGGDALSGGFPNYAVYATKDGAALSVGALEPKFWRDFCEAVRRPDWVSKSGVPELREEVAALMATRTRDEWEAIFAATDACVEVARTPREAFAHPQAVHRGRTEEEFQLPFGLSPSGLGSAPALGEHTEEILG